jgi:hypothetical protein
VTIPAAHTDYARDFLGYGANLPDSKWPNFAKITLSGWALFSNLLNITYLSVH